jgi:hypothetical protein
VGPNNAAPRAYATPYALNRYGSSRAYIASLPVYRPYYSFRPQFHLGFGLYIGYPVAFPSWYANPYYNDGYGYGYGGYGSGYVGAAPGYSAYGAVSFDLQPYDADVYVDGTYMGAAGEFDPTHQPLTLRSGRHHIELVARGYQPMAFDITVVAGQVIPYQGSMPAIR